MNKIIKSIKVHGMHCKSCESLIENEIKELKGIFYVKANYNDSIVIVHYNENLCDYMEIEKTIEKAGYSTKNNSKNNIILLCILALFMILLGSNSIISSNTSSLLDNASYIMLFIVGILSSLHCVGMCGGIMLTQTIRDENLNDERKPNLNSAFKYNLGRVISYTLLGGVIGSLGSIFSLSMKSQGIIQMLAAVFMILAGCKLFGLNLLKNSNFSLSIFKNRCSLKSNNPFLIGLLNGFMPCGALQTMQVYALSTGSFINGAFSMFIFALGTVPLMLGFGYISSKLSRTFSNKVLKYSGIFIIVLGLSMAQRGFSLTGINIPSISSLIASYSSELEVAPLVDGYQNVTLTANRYGYSISHTITPDSPIKLTLIADKLTSCNSQIYLPDYDEYIDLTQGDVIVEIPPTNKDISITCWMGMINTSIKIQ